jgi:phosphoribosyl-ATP pyrophosphohydrolase/phosphoribosyl-ATP pyrophosphohydrolase/phosphoribosyl-AMP cyclohydrolase
MSDKVYSINPEVSPPSQIGATLEALVQTVASRRAGSAPSYSADLIQGHVSVLLGKVLEEAGEVVEAAQYLEDSGDGSDHLRWEMGDLLYHLVLALERFDISLDELAAELNSRMKIEECPQGGLLLKREYIDRGK